MQEALGIIVGALGVILVVALIARWRVTLAGRKLIRFLRASGRDGVAILTGEKFSKVHHVDAMRALDQGLTAQGLTVTRLGLNAMSALGEANIQFATILNNSFWGGYGSLQRVRREVGPGQHAELHSGALCLCEGQGHKVAVMLMQGANMFEPLMHFEVATRDTPEARAYATELLEALTAWMFANSVYRGQALIPAIDPMGYLKLEFGDIPLPPGLVFEERLREDLESNFLAFVEHREALGKMGIPARRGLLLLGPPGSGKTSTCRYLRSRLPGHSFFVVPSELLTQAAALFQAARTLAPSVVVIEDVDLAVRTPDPAFPNPHLKDLLNELDGLQDRQDVMVVLTSNSKLQLEQALADRPGRIDHTIRYEPPGPAHRKNVLSAYIREMSCLVPLDELSQMCEGLTPAAMFEVVKKAAVRAVRRSPGKPEVSALDVRAALDDLAGKPAPKERTIRPFPVQ